MIVWFGKMNTQRIKMNCKTDDCDVAWQYWDIKV